MLINVSDTTVSAPKQIAIRPSAVNTIIYAVPAGKTFTGNAIAMNQMDFFINGVNAFSQATTPTNSYWDVPLTLVGGSVITNGPSYTSWILLGVEQ